MFCWDWKCNSNLCLQRAILIQGSTQAVQGYQFIRNDNLATPEIENRIQMAKEIIEIEDDSECKQVSASDSDSESSSEDVPIPAGVEDWVRNTQASQPSLQYYDLETSKWMSKDEDVSDQFLGELKDVGNLDNNSPDNGNFAENDMDIARSTHHDREMENDPINVPADHHPKELMNLDELCADVMKMHRDEDITQVQETRNMEADYGFAWTGM